MRGRASSSYAANHLAPSPCPLPASGRRGEGARFGRFAEHVARHRRRNDRRRGPHLQGRRAGRRRDHQGDRRGPQGRQHARRGGLFRHAGRHRPAHPSRHALHGHELGRQLRERHQGRVVRRHHDGRRFLHSGPQPAADGGLRRLGQALQGRRLRLFLPHVHHLLERAGAARTWPRWSRRASRPSSISWPTRAR